MIAADTAPGSTTRREWTPNTPKSLQAALEQGSLVIPLVVLVEILSGPGITRRSNLSSWLYRV